SRKRHTTFSRDWSSDVCSSDLLLDSPAARVSAFVDFGNVFKDMDAFDAGELRASAGIALMWRAPVGPISISYAYPIRSEDNDERSEERRVGKECGALVRVEYQD